MCSVHWYSLRKAVRDAILHEYHPGQEISKNPSLRYMAVQRHAIAEALFKPNDERAAGACAPYLVEADAFRRQAIAAGEGDPLIDLLPLRSEPLANFR